MFIRIFCSLFGNTEGCDKLYLTSFIKDFNILMFHSGAWNLQGKKFHSAGQISSWGVVVFAEERRCGRKEITSFCKKLVEKGAELGMTICNNPAFLTYYRHGDPLESIFDDAKKKDVKLVLAVLPGKTQYYGEFY